MDYQMQYFCRNIKHFRESKGLSRTETAKVLHITVQTLDNIENGRLPKRLSIHILTYASDFFDTSVIYLFTPPQNNTFLLL